jgi:hypothetical protein
MKSTVPRDRPRLSPGDRYDGEELRWPLRRAVAPNRQKMRVRDLLRPAALLFGRPGERALSLELAEYAPIRRIQARLSRGRCRSGLHLLHKVDRR